MSKFKFDYSMELHTPEGTEIFRVRDADSFDEAIGIVKKGVRDRWNEITKIYPTKNSTVMSPKSDRTSFRDPGNGPGDFHLPPPTGGPVPAPNKIDPPSNLTPSIPEGSTGFKSNAAHSDKQP